MTAKTPFRRMPGTVLSVALAAAIMGMSGLVPAPVLAQEAAGISIAAGPLDAALRSFGRQTGLQISFRAQDTAGRSVGAIAGPISREAALERLLAGTGLSWRMEGARSVVISAAGGAAEALGPESGQMLGTIMLGGNGGPGWNGAADTVFSTPEPVSVISGDVLREYKLTTPSDIFKGTTGVMSGDSRNSGSLNVNIHGMQGQGRVPVRVDGAENAAVAYRGYQGNTDRSFVDPDFIGSVGITKGPSGDRPGIGGSVEIRTIEASDILLPGKDTGFRLRVSASGNTTDPEFWRASALTSSFTRGESSKRPSFLNPTAGSASLAWAKTSESFDIVAGLSWRNQGNYHAGTDGPVAEMAMLPCAQVVNPLYCGDPNELRAGNGGMTPYFGGEEVMNTSSESRSGLIKATIRLSDDVEWKLGYSHYETEFGEVLASRVTANSQAVRQRVLSETKLDSVTSRMRWNPEGSALIDLRWNLWATSLSSSSAATYDSGAATVPSVTDNLRWGTELANTMRPEIGFGDLTVTVGASYLSERSKPSDRTRTTERDFPPRDAKRSEASLFARAIWEVTDQVAINGSLRYTRFESEDFNTNIFIEQLSATRSDDSLDPSIGVAYTPWQGVQFYANYREATRLPSLIETTIAYGIARRSDPGPETARNIDLGVNLDQASVFADGDKLGVKVSYFDNRIKDYIARTFSWGTGLTFYNIDEARFRGLEVASRYEKGGFAAGLSATYYLDVDFCATAGSCANSSLASDLAANHIPPKFQIAFDMSQKFLDDRLTLGGRVTRVGSRAAASETPFSGMLPMSAPILWKPYTTVDVYARYTLREGVDMAFDVENLTDAYHVEPLSLGQIPSPGRTARLSLDWRF